MDHNKQFSGFVVHKQNSLFIILTTQIQHRVSYSPLSLASGMQTRFKNRHTLPFGYFTDIWW